MLLQLFQSWGHKKRFEILEQLPLVPKSSAPTHLFLLTDTVTGSRLKFELVSILVQ